MSEFEGFRAGIDDVVRDVQRCVRNYEVPRKLGEPASKTEQLSPDDCQRIRNAIALRHDPVKVRDQLWGTEMAENIGYRFLDQLAEAEKNLKPDQVRELVALALAGIPERP
jgi:hypothetical protein